MEQLLTQNARHYASRHQLRLAERLGFGIHGIIFVAEGNAKTGRTAVKIHRSAEPYRRERDIYERLAASCIDEVSGFNVPHLIAHDDELLVIEMSIVTRPFLLDFAGAYLGGPPEFPEDAWQIWEAEKREQFDARWPRVQAVLATLKEMGIFMVDVSPGNISFLD